MKNSSLLVFSVLYNLSHIIKKRIDNVDGVFKMRPFVHFKNTRKIYIDNSKRIYNELENNYYDYKDLILYVLYSHGMGKNISNWYNITTKEINRVSKIFTKKQYNKDKEFILKLNEQLKLKSVAELFEMRQNGSPIIYELIKKEFISPVIFVKFHTEVLTLLKKDDILIDTGYEQFEYSMNLIIKTLKFPKGVSSDE